jgi:hypothetical protein
MHDRGDPVLVENPVQQVGVTQITLDKGPTHQKVAMPTREIVQDNHLMTGVKQIQHHVRTDIARAAHDKNSFTGHDVVS